MSTLNLEKTFDKTNYKYYDPSFLISTLERILEKKLGEVKNYINNLQIYVTDEQIIKFLEKTFQEENPELKQRIEIRKRIKSQIDSDKLKFTPKKVTTQNKKEMTQEFTDRIAVGRYQFEPYTLEYFNRYTTIVRNKALQLLNIIEQIGAKKSTTIQDLLTELDIQLDENGNITEQDIIRLIDPTIQNINELYENITKANDLSTYLTFKMSKRSLDIDNLSEEEIYPTESIFIKDRYNGHNYGNVPISKRQSQELRNQYRKMLGIK